MQEKDMSITSPPRDRRSLAARLALVSTVSLGLVAGPIALAAPAVADAKSNGCTVKALKPEVKDTKGSGHKKGEKKFVKVEFAFKIKCDKKARVHFEQVMFQKDGKRNVEIGSSKGNVWVHKNITIVKVAKVYDKDRHEKYETVFHYVKIREQNKDKYGKWAKWSDFDKSPKVRIYVPGGHY
jgi:hypothetical protein